MNGTRDTLPKRTNERKQGRALTHLAKRLSLKVCGNCETRGYVYKAHEPLAAKWKLWCYMCGAKDEQCESVTLRADNEYIPMKQLRETIAMLERELYGRGRGAQTEEAPSTLES